MKSCRELLQEFERLPKPLRSGKLVFEGVGDRDVYNITAPFLDGGRRVIAGRVEPRSTEISHIGFFVEDGGAWRPRPDSRTLPMQDPFQTRIHGQLVVGGVEIETDADERIVDWRTAFYRGPDVDRLAFLTAGPRSMKDIRVVELPNGRVGVFTRPHGLPGARARIGYTEIADLDGLDARRIAEAELFTDQFLPDEWGGANEVHRLANGWLGILGHVSYRDERDHLHYHAMTFAFEPETKRRTPLRIIATRASFPEGAAKAERLRDVVFSGGLVRNPDGTACLYAGLGDAEAGWALIQDPFTEYERLT